MEPALTPLLVLAALATALAFKPWRLLAYVVLSGAGIHLAVAGLGDRPLVALLAAGAVVAGAMLALGVARPADLRHLVESMHAPAEPDSAPGPDPFTLE